MSLLLGACVGFAGPGHSQIFQFDLAGMSRSAASKCASVRRANLNGSAHPSFRTAAPGLTLSRSASPRHRNDAIFRLRFTFDAYTTSKKAAQGDIKTCLCHHAARVPLLTLGSYCDFGTGACLSVSRQAAGKRKVRNTDPGGHRRESAAWCWHRPQKKIKFKINPAEE